MFTFTGGVASVWLLLTCSDEKSGGTPPPPPGPGEFGAACAFLCSQHAAYITAQNILVDGGLYPGTF